MKIPENQLFPLERKEDHWTSCGLISLETGEQNRDMLREPQEPVPATMDRFRVVRQNAILALRASMNLAQMPEGGIPLTADEEQATEAMIQLLLDPDLERKFERVAMGDRTTPASVVASLKAKYPSIATSHIQSVGAERGYKRKDMDNYYAQIPSYAMRNCLEQSRALNFFFFSDSHRTSGDILFGIKSSGYTFATEKTAVLSFDHHTDTWAGEILTKATVMRTLRERGIMRRGLVVGVKHGTNEQAVDGIDFLDAENLHTSGQPSSSAFDQGFGKILQSWIKAGIEQVYLSIDVDSLRLDTLGLHATDYAPMRNLWRQMRAFAGFAEYFRENAICPVKQWAVVKGNGTKMKKILKELDGLHEPYLGIPATWIPRAIRNMQAHGLQLGIKIARDSHSPAKHAERRILGDIVEIEGNDPKFHTKRLASAIVESVVTLA